MIRRWTVALGVVAALCFHGVLLARPGAVTTSDGSTFVGDVTESGDKIIVKDGDSAGIEIAKANVSKTTYFKSIEEEYEFRSAQIDPSDAPGHLAVARWAINNDQPELARKSAQAALKADPASADAKAMLQTLDEMDAPPKTEGEDGDGPKATKMRLVTPEEVNRIRQVEWNDRDEDVRVRIDPKVKTSYLARLKGMTPQQFNRLPVPRQGREILKHGTEKMREGVHLLTDPASMLEYRRNVQKIVLAGCATTGCHDSKSTTTFKLYTDKSDEADYTNFLILQKYRTTIDDTERLMIDRDQPGDSLLSEFILPPTAAETPHPEVEGLKPVVKNLSDPRYEIVSDWIYSLPAVQPDYRVDLTQPPPAPRKQSDRPAPKGGAARDRDR